MMYKKQTGAALPVALIVLLIVTVLGISSMSTSTMDIKMAKNLEDAQVALHGIERRAQGLVNTLKPGPIDPKTDAETKVKTEGESEFVAQTPLPSNKKAFLFSQDASLSSQTGVILNHFNLDLDGSTPTGARKNLLIGFAIVGPK